MAANPGNNGAINASDKTASFAVNILTWFIGIGLAIFIGWWLGEWLKEILVKELVPKPNDPSGGKFVLSFVESSVTVVAWVGKGSIFFLSCLFIGYGGFRRIDPVHRAYVEVLAHRFSWPILGEGWVWIPPYIAKPVSYSTQTIRVDLEENGTKEITINSKDGIDMAISGSALVRISDPYRASANGETSEEVARKFGDTFEKAVRGETTKHPSEALSSMKDDISNSLRTPPENYQGDIKDHLASRAFEYFGITLVEVAITGIGFPLIVRTAREEEAKEIAQKRARRTEFDSMLERVNDLVRGSNGTMTAKEAWNRILISEGDKGANVKIFEGLDGGRTPIILDTNDTGGTQ